MKEREGKREGVMCSALPHHISEAEINPEKALGSQINPFFSRKWLPGAVLTGASRKQTLLWPSALLCFY